MRAGEDEAKQYLIACLYRGLQVTTVTAYADELERFLDWCQRRRVDPFTLNVAQAEAYAARSNYDGKRPLPSNVRLRTAILRGFYRWLWEHDHTPYNLMSKVRDPKVPKPNPKPITDEQFNRLWLHTKGDRIRAAMVLTYCCGLRTQEIMDLRTDQINIELIVDFTRKGGKVVRLPWRRMIDTLVTRLPIALPINPQELYTAIARVKHYPTIVPPVADRSNWLRAQFYAACKRAGLPQLNPHRGRASAITNQLRAEVPPQLAKWLLDIEKWETLNHYIKAGRLEYLEWYHRRVAPLMPKGGQEDEEWDLSRDFSALYASWQEATISDTRLVTQWSTDLPPWGLAT